MVNTGLDDVFRDMNDIDAEQVAAVLADDRAPVFAYLGNDPTTPGGKRTITTWTGGALPLTITQWREHDDYRSGGHGLRNRYATGRAQDTRGRPWTFRAAVDNGTYIRLRPIKNKR